MREASGLPVSAVGLAVAPEQADQVLVNQAACTVMLARELLRNPHWPWTAARTSATTPLAGAVHRCPAALVTAPSAP